MVTTSVIIIILIRGDRGGTATVDLVGRDDVIIEAEFVVVVVGVNWSTGRMRKTDECGDKRDGSAGDVAAADGATSKAIMGGGLRPSPNRSAARS